MYPILCPGGYGVPMKAGKMEIVAIVAAGSDASSSSRLTLLDYAAAGDKMGTFIKSKTKDYDQIIDIKRVAACEPNITFYPALPIKTRSGISVLRSSNMEPGSITVYVR